MMDLNIDSSAVQAALKTLSKSLSKAVDKGSLDLGNELLRLSQYEVPHDEGTLQNSGVVEEIEGDVVVGYHVPYAARLHEHPEYRFQAGRKGKYLEDPINRNEDVLGLTFVKTVAKEALDG